MQRRPNYSCPICETRFYARPSAIETGRVFCSRVCCGIAQRQNHKDCPSCGKSFVGTKKFCSRACSNVGRAGISYKTGRTKDKHIQQGVLKMTLAERSGGLCERCHHGNFAILQIHHRTPRCDGGTDDLDNLELLCPNCHMTHHQGTLSYAEAVENRKGGRVRLKADVLKTSVG